MDAFGTAAGAPVAPDQKLFSVQEANRALALVRRITSDIVARAKQLATIETDLAVAKAGADQRAVENLTDTRAELRERLREYIDELAEIGVLLKDVEIGLVDFPALRKGRLVYLCWRLGEDAVSHWHEQGDGFAGRQPIGADFA